MWMNDQAIKFWKVQKYKKDLGGMIEMQSEENNFCDARSIWIGINMDQTLNSDEIQTNTSY